MEVVLFFIYAAVFFVTGIMVLSTARERHLRASVISLALFTACNVLFYYLIILDNLALNVAVIVMSFLVVCMSLLKIPIDISRLDLEHIQQFDERDHMFSRYNLKNHPELSKVYYSMNPDKKEKDEANYKKPGLLQKGSLFYESAYAKIGDAAFSMISKTHNQLTGTAASVKNDISSDSLTDIVKKLGKYYGALDIGFTSVKHYHLYSVRGRKKDHWGDDVINTHKSAVVIVVKMDLAMINHAPALPAVIESSRQYVESAKIAYIIAEYLRSLGFEARSHVDGDYEVICPPLAEDAILGKVGRMGLFMHPEAGPCVRISAVTTNAEFAQNKNTSHYEYINEFCKICKKCADNCPTQSIENGDMKCSRGFDHWSIDQEKCFSYWNTIGTDCGFCIKTCPFTRPDSLFHRLAKWYISRNRLNRRLALLGDDILYGRRVPLKLKNPAQIL